MLKRWIRVSSCNFQKKHKGEGDFPKRNSMLLRYNTLLSMLYKKALKLVRLLIFPGRKYNYFLSKFQSGNKELKCCCEVGMIFFLETNIKHNF